MNKKGSIHVYHNWNGRDDVKSVDICGLTWRILPNKEDLSIVTVDCNLPPLWTIYFSIDATQYRFDQPFKLTIQYNKVVSPCSSIRKNRCIKTVFDDRLNIELREVCVVSPDGFLHDSELTDVTLIVEDHKLHLNKAILAMSSPVLKAMFFGNFAEAQSKIIQLKDKNASTFIDFLTTFYNANPFTSKGTKSFSFLRAGVLYHLYHEYQMEAFVEYCQDELKNFYSNIVYNPGAEHLYIESVLQHGLLAETYDMDWLIEKVIELLSQTHTSKWRKNRYFLKLSHKTRYEILFKRLDKNDL